MYVFNTIHVCKRLQPKLVEVKLGRLEKKVTDFLTSFLNESLN